jgi:Tfp pilus assembly protein PilF
MPRSRQTNRVATIDRLPEPALRQPAWERRWPIALLLLAVLATYWPVCTADFVNWDDALVLARNPMLNPVSWSSVKAWWAHGSFQLYEPVTWMTRAALTLIARVPEDPTTHISLNPYIYHSFNLLLHALNTLIAFQLLKRIGMRIWPACAGALVFALHPLQVEPVAWVTSIKDLLFGFFSLLTIWRYLICLGTPEEEKTVSDRRRGFALASFLYLLAILAKVMAAVDPIIVLILVRLIWGRIPRRVWKEMTPWVLLAVAMLIITRVVQPGSRLAPVALWKRPLVATDALAFYLWKVVFPFHMTIDYGRTPARIFEQGWAWWTWIAPAMLLALLWKIRRFFPAVVAGASTFIVSVAPVLGLNQFIFQKYSTVADRYTYLAMFGVALCAADIVNRLPKRAAVWAIVAVAMLGISSWRQTWRWRDSWALMNYALAMNPRSYAAYGDLGAWHLENGNYDAAIQCARQSIAIKSDEDVSLRVLANALVERGRTSEAIATLRAAAGHNPAAGLIAADLSGSRGTLGRLDDAMAFGRLAVELAPELALSHANLGSVLVTRGKLDEAKVELEKALALQPADVTAQCNLAFVLAKKGQTSEAVEHFRAALRLDPDCQAAKLGIEAIESAGGAVRGR